jgi:hypothetical protein
MDTQILHSFEKDECEFTISSVKHENNHVEYVVDCWKKDSRGEYSVNHWCLYYRSKEAATNEFNRWGGAYVP